MLRVGVLMNLFLELLLVFLAAGKVLFFGWLYGVCVRVRAGCCICIGVDCFNED